MGVTYFMTSYMQTVLGFSALETGERMLPIAGGMILTAKAAVAMTRRLGTKVVVATGLGVVGAALFGVSGSEADTGDGPLCLTLGLMGAGMGLPPEAAAASVAAAITVAGALVAALFLPARARAASVHSGAALPDGAAA